MNADEKRFQEFLAAAQERRKVLRDQIEEKKRQEKRQKKEQKEKEK